MEEITDEIYILNSDSSVRESLEKSLLKAGFSAVFFSDGCGLLVEARRRQPLCILLDLVTPLANGFVILRSLTRHSYPAPVIVLSGDGTIQDAVNAMKLGAYDVVEKPIHKERLVAKIRSAIEVWRPNQKSGSVEVHPNEPLTRREEQVLARLLVGRTNKSIANELGLSSRTIEYHRFNLMHKFAVKTMTQLLLKAGGPNTDRSPGVSPTPKRYSLALETISN